MRQRATLLVRFFAVVDTLVLAVLLAETWLPPFTGVIPDLLIPVLIVPFWLALFQFFGVYESHRMEGTWSLFRRIMSAQFVGFCVLALGVLGSGDFHRLKAAWWFATIGTVLLLGERAAGYWLAHWIRSHGYDKRNVCVIGSWETAQGMQTKFAKNPEWALQVTCVGTGRLDQREYLTYPEGRALTSNLNEVLQQCVIDEVLIAVPTEGLPDERVAVKLCEECGLIARVLLRPSGGESRPTRLDHFCGEMSIMLGGVKLSGVHAVLKRATDIGFALALLVLSMPVMLVAALLVKLSSSGAILFKQRRAGLHGRPFTIYKFRTMFEGSEAMVQSLAKRSVTGGPAFKDPCDVRLTPIGRLLRRFSIDELPQLLNVLIGDMSLVGPRPLPLHEAAAINGEARRRFSVRPGLTCLWQVNGRSNVEFTRWMQYDLEYVDRWSPWLDLKLLLQTVPAVLSGKGAY